MLTVRLLRLVARSHTGTGVASTVSRPSLGVSRVEASCSSAKIGEAVAYGPSAEIGEAVANCLFTVPIRWQALIMELV